MTCEQCHSRLVLSNSISHLSPSVYDFVNHSISFNSHQYGHQNPPVVTPTAPTRAGTNLSNTVLESFVLVKPSVPVPPAPSTTLASLPTNENDSITVSNARLTSLFSLLSSVTPTISTASAPDHPLCKECVAQLLSIMSKELETIKKERDRLIGFEREVVKRREEGEQSGAIGKEGLKKEILKLKKAEQSAMKEVYAIEIERESLNLEKAALDAEEAELAAEEEEFWKSHAKYLLHAATIKDQIQSLQTRYSHDLIQFDKLQKTNVYNDVFCIGQEGGIGTINGLRLGRLPNVPVEWSEINAAWGHTLLLMFTIARKYGFVFETYRLIPMASFSRIEKLSGDKAIYELYGSGDFQLNRLLLNRRFDQAMVAFLDCLKQLMEFIKAKDRTLNLPHSINKDRIGEVSIKLQFGSDEIWSRALRHVLLNLKIILAKAST